MDKTDCQERPASGWNQGHGAAEYERKRSAQIGEELESRSESVETEGVTKSSRSYSRASSSRET
jgi:hypothetical protein